MTSCHGDDLVCDDLAMFTSSTVSHLQRFHLLMRKKKNAPGRAALILILNQPIYSMTTCSYEHGSIRYDMRKIALCRFCFVLTVLPGRFIKENQGRIIHQLQCDGYSFPLST